MKRAAALVTALLVLASLVATLTPDQVSEIRRLNAAHKQTGVYITRLRAIEHRTPYQQARYRYWLSKRAEFKARILAIKAATPEPTPKPATAYVGGAPGWDNAWTYVTTTSPYLASTTLGTRSVWHPAIKQTGLPVFVIIPGGPLPPDDTRYGGITANLASRGAVVFEGVYRSQRQYDGGAPQAYQDVGCTIRAARALAVSFGGNPSRVTLVAHSFGGLIASQVISQDTPPGPDCAYSTGAYKPDQYVSIDAISHLDQVGQAFLASDYPGAVRPWRGAPIPVVVAWGWSDMVARINEFSPLFAEELALAGWPVRSVSGAWDHSYPLIADEVLDVVAR